MLSALHHAALADKFRSEGRDAESSSEETDYESEMKAASRMICIPTFLYVFVVNALFLVWAYGVTQALKADDELCNGSVFAFWVLFIMNILNCGVSGNTIYKPPSGNLVV